MQTGTAKVVEKRGGMSGGGNTYIIDVLAFEAGGRKYAFAWNATDGQYQNNPPYAGSVYRDCDPATDAGAIALFSKFATYGVETYEWTSPLTDIPSSGGMNPLDVYPVGIEITTTDTAFNPMKVWGGTWTVTPAGAKRVWKRTA